MVQKVNSTNTFGVAKFVVSADATQGTHTTIQAAINDAVTGDSIFVRAGSYNENLTLKGGVTLFTGLAQGSANIGSGGVVLVQGCTLPLTGLCTFQGFYFNFGAAANMFLDISGGGGSVTLFDCGFNFASGSTVFKCDNGQTNIRLYNCIGTGTAQFYSIASGGTFQCYNCNIQAPGGSPTASAAPSGSSVYYYDSKIGFPTTLTAATFAASNCYFYTSNSAFPFGAINNNTLITTVTSGTYEFKGCQFSSGSASAISVGSGSTVKLSGCCDINSSNTNAITGAGTLIGSTINFSGSSSTTNVTSQTLGAVSGLKGATPAAGFVGEVIQSTVALGSAVAIPTINTAVNITSISLTPGIWMVSAQGLFTPTGAANGEVDLAISTTSATIGTRGDNDMFTYASGGLGNVSPVYVADYRLILAATTTVYLVGRFAVAGTSTAGYGRISATRVG